MRRASGVQELCAHGDAAHIDAAEFVYWHGPQANRAGLTGRGIRCVTLDYDAMRGIEREDTLF